MRTPADGPEMEVNGRTAGHEPASRSPTHFGPRGPARADGMTQNRRAAAIGRGKRGAIGRGLRTLAFGWYILL